MNPTTARLKLIEARHHLTKARKAHDALREDTDARLCVHYRQIIGKAKEESIYVD